MWSWSLYWISIKMIWKLSVPSCLFFHIFMFQSFSFAFVVAISYISSAMIDWCARLSIIFLPFSCKFTAIFQPIEAEQKKSQSTPFLGTKQHYTAQKVRMKKGEKKWLAKLRKWHNWSPVIIERGEWHTNTHFQPKANRCIFLVRATWRCDDDDGCWRWWWW